jgi:hypothetical protein
MKPIFHSVLVAATLSGLVSLAACAPASAIDTSSSPRAAVSTASAGPNDQPGMTPQHMAQMMQMMCAQKPPQASEAMPTMPGNEAMQTMMRQHMAMMQQMCAGRTGSTGAVDQDAMRGMMDQHMRYMQQMMTNHS